MFFYNNPYVSSNFNGYLPVFQDTGENIYDDHDDAYDYKLVDGVWQTRAKGSQGDWISLEGNEEATNKLNEAYPDAIQDPNDDNNDDNNDDDNEDNDGNEDNITGGLDIDAANESIGKTNNLDFKNPESGTILDTIGDNPMLSLIHAVGTTINSFKGENYYDPGTKEDYMKLSITNPTDQDMYINPTQFEKSPNKPWKYLEDQEQVVEREFQQHLDDRHERNPEKYAKVNDFDSDLYEETGHLNYEDGPKQGDLIEEQFPEATHLNWNVDPNTGQYTTAHSYMQEADDDLPATQFNIGDSNYQAHAYPTPKVNTQSQDLSEDADGDGVPDYLTPTQERYGRELPKAQSSLNLDLYQSQGILGSEGQGYNPLSNVTLDNNISNQNFGTYGAVNSNDSMQSPESQPFYDISDQLYASTQNVARTQEKWDAFNADFNERLQNPSLSMLDTKTDILEAPSLNQDLLNQTQKISDMAYHREARLDGRTFTDDQGNEQIIKSTEEIQDSIDESNAKMQEVVDEIPEYEGTQEALDDLAKSEELGFDSREDYKDFEKQQEEEELARELRTEDIKDANKDNQPSTADKLWNLKNRIVDSKAGQTFSKIGAGAVRIAKPLNKILADKEARKRKADMMNNAYLSDNMVASTDADITGSKGNYDANTGLFRPDDKVIAGTTGSARYGSELFRASKGLEYFKNNYPGYDDLTADQQKQLIAQYSGNTQSQRFDKYSDDYIKTMEYKDQYNTSGYNPVISDLPNWVRKPNEGWGRIIIDDEMERMMKGQIAGGHLSPKVQEDYVRFLSGYTGPSAIDYNLDKYDRWSSWDPEKQQKFNYSGMGFGYKDNLPGKGAWDTVYGHYSPETLTSWMTLADKVNESRYPDLDENAIALENNKDFMRDVGKEFYKIKKQEQQEDNYLDEPLVEIEEDIEDEENPFLVAQEEPISISPVEVKKIETKSSNPELIVNRISANENPATNRQINKIQNEQENSDPYAGMSPKEKRKAKRAAMFADAYTPQTMRKEGGEAEIDMNTYKQLIAAGAQIEIL